MFSAKEANEKAKKIRIKKHIKWMKQGVKERIKKGKDFANLKIHCYVIYTLLDQETIEYFQKLGYEFKHERINLFDEPNYYITW